MANKFKSILSDENNHITHGNVRIVGSNESTDQGIPWIRSNGDYLVLNAVDGDHVYLNWDAAAGGSGHVYVLNDIYAGTLYDRGNTAYYVNQNSTSKLYDLTIERGEANNHKIDFKSTSTAGYSALRFSYNGTEQNTIHAFGTAWSNSTWPGNSAGAINLSGYNGVTIGSWSSPGAWIYNDGEAQFEDSVRSPIFYDSAATAYYVDPSNGANGISANLQGRIQVGTFNQSQTNSGEAWIGRAADRSAGSLTVQLGTGTGRKFEVVDYGWTTVEFEVNDSGTAFAAGDFRAPIFYDSNNTGYYVHPDSTSNLYGLTVNQTISGTVTNGLQLTREDNRTISPSELTAGRLKFGFTSFGNNNTSPYADFLHMRSYTDSSGGHDNLLMFKKAATSKVRLYTQSFGSATAYSSYMDLLDTSGDDQVKTGYIQSNDSLRAPIFYDSNDTNYYLDPASTSNVNGLTVAGTLTFNGGNVEGYVSYTVDMSNTSTYAENTYYPVTIPVSSNKIYNFRIENALNSNVPGWSTHSSGFSLLLDYTTHGNGWGTHSQSRYIRLYSERFANVQILGGITQMTNSSTEVLWLRGGGKYYVKANKAGLTLTPRTSTYTIYSQSVSPTTSVVNDVYSAANGSGFAVQTMRLRDYIYHADDSDTYFGFNAADGWKLHVGGGDRLIASTTQLVSNLNFQAPVFYDTNNTNYYLDPNGTSNLYNLDLTGAKHTYLQINPGSSHESMVRYMGSAGSSWYVGKRTATQNGISTSDFHWYSQQAGATVGGITTGGVLQVTGSHRAPIFYDSNDTNYYIDPGSTSIVKYLGRRAHQEGLMVGGYNNVGASHAKTNPIFTIGSSYLPNETTLGDMYGIGYTRGDMSGMPGTSGWGMYVAADGDARIFLDGQNGGIGTASASWRAPIFYDSNNTGYYVDPASTTRLNGLDIWSGGVQYWYRSGGNAHQRVDARLDGSDQARMHWYGRDDSGNTRNFKHAWYDGGDYVNVTAASDFIYFDRASGTVSVQADGSFRAPVFYDSDNTDYYVDPASLSKLSQASIGTTSSPPSSSYSLNMGGHIDMNAQEINYVSQLHFNDNLRFYDGGNDSYLNYKYGDTNAGGILFRNGSDTIKGYVYADNSGFGLLDNDGAWAVRTQLGTDPLELRCDNNVEFEVHTGYTYSPGSSRAPIFYDSDSTSYYVNPAGNSQFSAIYYNEWIRNNRSTSSGLYWESGSPGAGWHIYPASTSDMYMRSGSSSSGSLRLNTTGTDRGYLYWNNSNNVGFLSTAAGWTLKVDNSGNTFATASHRAPVFYDSADTTYYLDPAATGDSLRVAGDVVAYYSSDKRLKDNIKPIDNALDKVCSLSGNTFEWNEISHKETGKKDIGVVAQEVEEVFPEIVNTRDSGYKAVDYQKLSAVLIEAIKELKEEVEELKNKCNDCTK